MWYSIAVRAVGPPICTAIALYTCLDCDNSSNIGSVVWVNIEMEMSFQWNLSLAVPKVVMLITFSFQLREPRIWCCHYLPPGSLLTLGHQSLFHTATSLLIWYKMFCMRDISYRLIWMQFINMLSEYGQSGMHRSFNWWKIVVLT